MTAKGRAVTASEIGSPVKGARKAGISGDGLAAAGGVGVAVTGGESDGAVLGPPPVQAEASAREPDASIASANLKLRDRIVEAGMPFLRHILFG